eukprot:jgi/Mesvir1/15120/Mv14759-RA.1
MDTAREAQIVRLLDRCRGSRSMDTNRTVFEVPIALVDGTPAALIVAVPYSFPNSPPTIELAGRGGSALSLGSFPGRSEAMAAIASRLRPWGPTSDLSEIVREAAEILQRGSAPVHHRRTSSGGRPPATETGVASPRVQVAPLPARFPELESMSAEGLADLLSTDKLANFLRTTDMARAVVQAKNHVTNLAMDVLAAEDDLRGYQEATVLLHSQYEIARRGYQVAATRKVEVTSRGTLASLCRKVEGGALCEVWR